MSLGGSASGGRHAVRYIRTAPGATPGHSSIQDLLLSDFYNLRRSHIVDASAALGFTAGLIAAAATRWTILDVSFRYGNFARAVLDFSKTMLWWGLIGGVVGTGIGIGFAWSWQRLHMWNRARRERPPAAPASAGIGRDDQHPTPEPNAASREPAVAIGPITPPQLPSIRYDTAAVPIDAFLALARRVWPQSYDAPRAAEAIGKTINVGAWDGTRLVGVVRVLTDGYFFAAVPEIFVDPAYRKRGIGGELMRRALDVSPAGTLVIGGTSDSLGFFQRLGCDLAPMGFVMRKRASPRVDRPA